jgi:tRNA-dihydrouridine synthase
MQKPDKANQTAVVSSHSVERRFCVAPMLDWTDYPTIASLQRIKTP